MKKRLPKFCFSSAKNVALAVTSLVLAKTTFFQWLRASAGVKFTTDGGRGMTFFAVSSIAS